MKLATALNKKNQLIGELNQLWNIFCRENSRREDNTSKIDAQAIYDKWKTKKKELIELKSAITRTNIGLYPVLAEMEELKSEIAALSTLSIKEGPEITFVFANNERQNVIYQWTAAINNEKRDKILERLQTRINELQEYVTTYNANTDVKFN